MLYFHVNIFLPEGITKSHKEQRLDYSEGEEMSWCPSWSNSLWQGWSCGLVYCPGGNATDPIWRVLALSDGIFSWTPLKPQHSNPNPNSNRLANQLWCIDFLTPPTPLILPHRLPAFLESLMIVTFGYSLSSQAVVLRQLRRWKRLWRRSLTRSHKRTSMGPSRSYWNGTTSALQPEEITSKGTRVSCVYYQ